MTFPRMMRWGDGKPLWVRPVHSVLALLDGMVVPFIALRRRVRADDVGHRILAPGRIIVIGVDD